MLTCSHGISHRTPAIFCEATDHLEGVDRDAAFAQLWVVTSFDVFDLLTGVGLDPDHVTRWMFKTTKQTLKLERLGGQD